MLPPWLREEDVEPDELSLQAWSASIPPGLSSLSFLCVFVLEVHNVVYVE